MMYPYVTLNDDTEITHSEMLPDGNRKVIEQFVKRYPRQYPEPESYMHLFSKNIRVKEVGVRMFERTTGVSSINMVKGVSYMISVSLAIIASSLLGKEKK